MVLNHRRSFRTVCAASTVFVGCLFIVSGCGWRVPDFSRQQLPPAEHPEAADTSSADLAAPEVPSPGAGAIPEADWKVLAQESDTGADGRRRSVWIRTIPEATEDRQHLLQAPRARWRYPDLDELLARPRQRQPAFHEALGDPNPVVATNAAIALARLGDDAGVDRLFEAAQMPKLLVPMRCAAIEALGTSTGEEPLRLLGQLLDQYGESSSPDGRGVYIPELHAELITALGRHLRPAADPRFLDALRSDAPDVRLAALRVWANDETAPLPEVLMDLRASGDVRVRMAVVEALAARRHADAHRLLADALRDHDLRVRVAAIRGLGSLGDDEARSILERLRAHRAGRMREAAVAALAQLGAPEAVFEAADDESWRVRVEVARALARFRGPNAAEVATRLLDDASSEVHRELLAAVAEWPVEESGSLLLAAMGKESFLCRKTAADQLAAKWPPAASFPVEGPPDRRRLQLERLQAQFHEAVGLPSEVAPEQPVEDQEPPLEAAELARVERLLAQEELAELLAFGPRAIGAIEILAIDRQRPVPETVYRRVLPELHPSFALLVRLEGPDAIERRRAAAELEALAEREPLGRLAVARLCQLATPEPDALVFQSVLSVIADNDGDAAHRIAYAAVGHPAGEVRRRGCLHLAAHPDPKHAPVLLPALEDKSESVVVAAVEALGACGQPAHADALAELLRSGSDSLRLEAAFALVRLKDPRGVAALERLSYSTDASVRRRVAEKMGELADPVFTHTLIRLLDDRVSVIRAALAALPQVAGEDMSLSPDGRPANTTERIRRWKAWFASR